MKITHVYRDSYPPLYGGIEQHIHTLVHQLKHHARADVLASGRHRALLDDDGVLIRSVGAWGRVQGAPISPALPVWIRHSRADIFHFHLPNPTGELAYLLSGSRSPAVATYHTHIVRQARAFRFYRPFYHAFLRRTAFIIVATPYHISTSAILPAYREKCRVIPFGIDVDRFQATPAIRERAAALRELYGPRLVLFVGKFRYYKGLDYLLRAMAHVKGRLLLIGEGEEEARLRALAEELGLGDRVVWLPHLEREPFLATLHACDVFALPSANQMEMFGIAQLEAHACGKPVVSTALGTGVEFVNLHEQTGLVVPPRDGDALADALNRLLDDPDYRDQLGEAARARAQAEFTQERMTAAVLDLYRETLEAKEARSAASADPPRPAPAPSTHGRSA
jgi:rhamnosyl/mannosyltransferase